MTARPPVLGQDLVDRLRSWSAGALPKGRVVRALRSRIGPPVRRMVARIVDPSPKQSIDQLHQGPAVASPEVEVLRAELVALHDRLAQLDERLDSVERAIRPQGR